MQLTKHHGLGNDFLVLLDLDDAHPIDADVARALCDRRRGIGADGLIRVTPGGADDADVTMELRNSDGGVAEMSGNGIRCLGQAVARDRGVAELELLVATDGGPRRLTVTPGSDDRTVEVEVDMGPVADGPSSSRATDMVAEAQKAATFDLGNPHLVLLVEDPTMVAIELEGPEYESGYPEGINVEWIAPREGADDALDLRVWERGAGLTEACGTGACAAAHAANQWGLVGERVSVHMPGGSVEVVLADGRATLIGPAVHIATIEVPWP